MLALDSEDFTKSVTQALNRPLQGRCAELTVLFDRASIRDLQNFFPILVDNIFGPHGTIGWGLRSITVTVKPQDFHTLQHFLSPCGPMLKLIYALLKDPTLKYDFSVAYLPMKMRQSLESSPKHPFYSELLQVNPQSRQIINLSLNPFDYYMFHFAYHLINPWHQRNCVTLGSSWSTAYYILCCDYILHFFPTNPNILITPIINYTGKNPPQNIHSLSRPARVSKLLRTTVINDVANDYTSLQTLEKHPRSEIWRSESVMTIFLDIWLNSDQVCQSNESLYMPSTVQTLHFNELPAIEYVRIIRVLVKQLHFFASSAKIDDSPMVELKKVTVPMMQGKMYVFLRNLIHHWPLDGSFRLVLELWLSFIQPWRYPKSSYTKELDHCECSQDFDDMNNPTQKTVDREYLHFIAENILAYVVIFQQILPRFMRVDLSSPKNSLMLYRLTKVFDQPNLVTLLKEVENCIRDRKLSPTHIYNENIPVSMPPLSPTSKWSTNTKPTKLTHFDSQLSMNISSEVTNFCELDAKNVGCGRYAGIIKQRMLELEGPNFCFKPLFSVPAAPEIYDLINQIRASEQGAHNIVHVRLDEEKWRTSGFLGYVKSLFIDNDGSIDEFTLEERKKVPAYLDFCLQYLTDMFQITEVVNVSKPILETSLDNRDQENMTNIQHLLTPERVKERMKGIKYEGDPDLLPVRSFENKFLVRMLYHWSTKINEKFHPIINKLYYQDSYIGKVSRQFICDPVTVLKYEKSHLGCSRRIAHKLPPRISLRYFAHHKFSAYLIVGISVSKFYSISMLTLLFFVCTVCFLYSCIKAIFSTNSNTHDEYAHLNDFGLNESF